MKMKLLLPMAGLLSACCTFVMAADLPRSASPEGAEVYIVSPSDGATVSSPLTVVFV